MAWIRHFRAATFLITIGWLQSCVTDLGPQTMGCSAPLKKLNTVVIYFDGWHTGMIFPSYDIESVLGRKGIFEEKTRYLEFGWGDSRFYQSVSPSIWLGVRALFYPTPSVIAIRRRQTVPTNNTWAINLTSQGYQNLLRFVAGSFARNNDKQILQTQQIDLDGYAFFTARGTFHAFNTCNSWVAAALEAGGLPLDSKRVNTAEHLRLQLRQTCKTPGRRPI